MSTHKNRTENQREITKNGKINGTNNQADMSDNNNGKPKLKDKVFLERKSLIQEMYDDVKHIRNIHYIFMVFLLTLFINQIADGIILDGRISLHINAILLNFADGHIAIMGWMILFGCTLLVHPVFQIWALGHNQMKAPILRKSWDVLWMTIVLGYYYKIFAWAGAYVTKHDLSFSSSFSLAIEATRLLMKTHAFIRANITKVLADKERYKLASKRHFLEFLFMPTLVYRDTYPRTKAINWTNVLIYVLELCACVFFVCYLYNMFFAEDCAHFKRTPSYSRTDFARLIFRNTIPSLGIMIIMFYFVLHLWQNLFGELTRFADRQFYQDWWNSTSYDEFYRKWNIVVHDWLYNYVYKDAFEALAPRTPLVPKLLVFLVSSVVHEYVLYYTMRMFYPVLGTIFFTFAMIFTSFRSPKYWLFNVLFLYGYGLGFSMTLTSYFVEYCVRRNPCAAHAPEFPFSWLYSKTLFSDCIL